MNRLIGLLPPDKKKNSDSREKLRITPAMCIVENCNDAGFAPSNIRHTAAVHNFGEVEMRWLMAGEMVAMQMLAAAARTNEAVSSGNRAYPEVPIWHHIPDTKWIMAAIMRMNIDLRSSIMQI